jgi:hypothetical protein
MKATAEKTDNDTIIVEASGEEVGIKATRRTG